PPTRVEPSTPVASSTPNLVEPSTPVASSTPTLVEPSTPVASSTPTLVEPSTPAVAPWGWPTGPAPRVALRRATRGGTPPVRRSGSRARDAPTPVARGRCGD